MKTLILESTIAECDIYKFENGSWSVTKRSGNDIDKFTVKQICSKIGQLEEDTFIDLSMLDGEDTDLNDIVDYCEVPKNDLIIYFVHNFNETDDASKYGYALLSKNVFNVNIERILKNDDDGILGSMKTKLFKLFDRKRENIMKLLGIENNKVKFTNVDDMCGNFTGAIFNIFKSLKKAVTDHSPIITASMMSKTSYRLLPLLKRAHLDVVVDEEDKNDMHELNVQGREMTSSTHDIMLIDSNTTKKIKDELGIFFKPFMKIIGSYLANIN